MKNKLEAIELNNSDESELIKIMTNSFSKLPQLSVLIKKPNKTEKFMKNLINLFKTTGKVKMFGIKKDGRILCCSFCVDSDAKPNVLSLLKFGFNMFILLGFSGLKELYVCDKNKPKYGKKCLELMLFGTLDNYQKKGLGKLMLDHLYDYARKNNYGGVTGVTNNIRPSFRFYIKEGWIIDKEFNTNDYRFCWVRKKI